MLNRSRPSRPAQIGLVGLVALVLCGAAGPARAEAPRVLFERQTPYGRVFVVEQHGRRCLRFTAADGGDQSCISLARPAEPVFDYVRSFGAALFAVPEPRRVLMVGLGGGCVIQWLRRAFPDVQVDVVELDPAVVEAAEKHFDVVPGPQLRVIVADGRRHIETSNETYDLILLDAFGADNIPPALTTREFLRAAAARLRPGGAVAANLWRDNDRLFRAMLATYRSVFKTVAVFPTPVDLNAIVVAGDHPLTAAAVLARARAMPVGRLPFDLVGVAQALRPAADYPSDDVPLLEDAHPERHSTLDRP